MRTTEWLELGKSILVLGTLDTKGPQIRYLCERIGARGHTPLVMDLSTGGVPSFTAHIRPEDVAQAVGKDIEEIRASRDRFAATEAMTAGACIKALELLSEGRIDGVIAIGGVTMALVGARVMQKLPFGMPKVIVVPAAMPTYVSEWFDATDLVVLQTIVEPAAINDLVKHSVEQAAGVICGMVEESGDWRSISLPYPSVAITELGFSLQCARRVEDLLKLKGYHVCSFHAQGIGDRAMDRLISQGLFDGLIDIVPAGLIEEVLQGNRAAGMERLDAPLERGIPIVLAPCCLNLTGCGPTRRNADRFQSRPRILKIDAMRAMTRLNEEELLTCARIYADKLNRAKGPVRVLIPLRGWSSIDKEGTVLYDPIEDRVLVDELKRLLNPSVRVIELDCNLEAPEFAESLVENFEELFKEVHTCGTST